MSTTLDLTADIIDVRDIIARVEELANQMPDNDNDVRNWPDSEEYSDLTKILDQLAGYSGDEKWRGDWYPVTLVRDSYFTDYCRELVQDVGDLPRELPDYIAIDWDATADNLRVDYSSVEVPCNDRRVSYWYR